MTSRLAVIPARGGSKRIPDKNIRDFGGRPMLCHILKAAEESLLFDAIHVSTDSAKIASVAKECGHQPEFLRPAALADDHTPLMPVLKFVIETFAARARRFDEVWLLMPCSPLIEADDLKAAAALFSVSGGAKPVMPVAPYPAPIEWAYNRAEDGRLIPVQKGMFSMRSQDLKARFYDAGSFYVFPTAHVLASEGAGDDSAFIGYVLPRHKAIDIDSEQDWTLAEMIFKSLRRQKEAGAA